ncbi:hypothetical protein G6F31_018468 [Rhizopus arrhizus]|nr:hypothetical protein G6F31_018468 [Rhizopus arrhizus]
MMVGSIGTFAINEALYKNLSYNPSKDFEYLTQAVRNPNVLVAATSFPAGSVAELVDYAKKHPGSVSYASSGTGSSDHLSAVLFRQRTDSTGVDVPYKGGGPAMIDVMSGQVPVMFASMGSAWQHVKNGKLRAVAVGGLERSKTAPDLPTIAESGVPGYETYEWNAVFAPAGTPPAIVDQVWPASAPSRSARRPLN